VISFNSPHGLDIKKGRSYNVATDFMQQERKVHGTSPVAWRREFSFASMVEIAFVVVSSRTATSVPM